MTLMNDQDFESLAHRSICYFLATFPSFYPIRSLQVSEDEQKAAWLFIKNIYQELYRNPLLMGFKPLPDDSFGDFEFQKVKPELTTAIRQPIKKVEEFMALLCRLTSQGQADGKTLTLNKSEIDIKPSNIKQLAAFGVKTNQLESAFQFDFPIRTNALKLLSETSITYAGAGPTDTQKPYLLFSRGIFDVAAPWSSEIFGNMLTDRTSFDKLIGFLQTNEFRRVDNKKYNNAISLDYIKNYGQPDDELKSAFAERTFSGIEVIYQEFKKNPLLVSLRIPYFKEILNNTDKMSPQVKSFVLSTTKKCDGCRYCVQTDRKRQRPLARIDIDGIWLCPLFPGFSYAWKTLNDKNVEDIIAMLEFIDELFTARRCK